MALLRMAFENYRCFKDRQEIELRPITLVLGKNNSGKSAITRLPLILQAGVLTSSSLPLDLDMLGDDPPEFLDLVYGRNMHRPLVLEFSATGDEILIGLKATIQNVDEVKSQIVSRLDVLHSTPRRGYVWEPSDGKVSNLYTYIQDGEPVDEGTAVFSGLIPSFDEKAKFEEITIEAASRDAFRNIRYIGPYRQRPTRLSRLPSKMAQTVGPAGENAVGMLINDHVRGDRQLIAKVNELLRSDTGLTEWQIEVESQGPLYAVILRSTIDSELAVNLLDSGTGVAQVLPLLVQRARDIDQGQSLDSALDIIEEPELHLHPAFHPVLADLFIAAASQDNRFLIETHSETLLLRLRRRIAEGRISPDDVAVYFVEQHEGASHARRIHIDEVGSLDYWPTGVFSEDFEEAKKLTQIRLSRERNAG
ncbi:AAA family ATPase [Actinomadura hibisca]|uniref:AAA family ATPase n=1 Tax=Actinomadura hibisca TaxID=68565 RepID=UPI0008369A0D|nr:DUF3696 domain-containing protein [Actinomadura hibisca]